jgi:heme exporter protein A
MADTYLEFRDLYRSFGRLRVLDAVSGRVAQGELLQVTGRNGSGKSTLLRCLAGLAAPQRGTITCRLLGQELDPASRRRAVGYVAPDVELYPELTTGENLDFFARLRGLAPERGRELLATVDLPADRAAGVLSSGMRQRLRWALALLHRPAILLLDEPLQNLDESGRQVTLGLLDQHLTAGGLAIIANPDRLDLPHAATHLALGS